MLLFIGYWVPFNNLSSFFHWSILIALLTFARIDLLIQFFVRSNKWTFGLFWKFALWSFNVKNASSSPFDSIDHKYSSFSCLSWFCGGFFCWTFCTLFLHHFEAACCNLLLPVCNDLYSCRQTLTLFVSRLLFYVPTKFLFELQIIIVRIINL